MIDPGQRLPGLLRLVAVLAIALAGCQPINELFIPTRNFDVVLPAGGDVARGDVNALPVTVRDDTALVVGIAAADRTEDPPGLVALPGRPNALRVEWFGGLCDRRTLMTLEAHATGYTIDVQTERTKAVCEALGIPRGVVIEFGAVVDPGQFTLSESMP